MPITKNQPRVHTPSRRRRKYTSKNKTKPARQEEPSSDDDSGPFYAVRDILDEKHEKGRLYYLIDWEDDPKTGERYEPTWEPAQNATKVAIADWETKKKGRTNPAVPPEAAREPHHQSLDTDSQPVPEPNWRAQQSKKRQRQDTESRSGASTSPNGKRRRLADADTEPTGSSDSKGSDRDEREEEQGQVRQERGTRPAQGPKEGPGEDQGDQGEERDENETEEEQEEHRTRQQDHQDRDEASWRFASSLPKNRSALIVGVSAQPTFDPSEYLPVDPSSSLQNPSQPTTIPETASPQQGVQTSKRTSQQTVPDSQDFFDSLPSHLPSTDESLSASQPEAGSQRSPSVREVHPNSEKGISSQEPSAAQSDPDSIARRDIAGQAQPPQLPVILETSPSSFAVQQPAASPPIGQDVLDTVPESSTIREEQSALSAGEAPARQSDSGQEVSSAVPEPTIREEQRTPSAGGFSIRQPDSVQDVPRATLESSASRQEPPAALGDDTTHQADAGRDIFNNPADSSTLREEQPGPSAEGLPSHQPDIPLPSIEPTQPSLEASRPTSSDDRSAYLNTLRTPPAILPNGPVQNLDPRSQPADTFLSQPAFFNLEAPSWGSSSRVAASFPSVRDPVRAEEPHGARETGSHLSNGAVVSETSPYSAQVVPTLNGNSRGIRTQSQHDPSVRVVETPNGTFSAREEPAVGRAWHDSNSFSIQAIERSPPPGLSSQRVAALGTGPVKPSEEDAAARPISFRERLSAFSSLSRPTGQKNSRPTTPNPVRMDSSSNPKKTPLSAVERFRNLYNEVYHPELAAGGTDQATNTAPPSADVPAPTGEVTVGVGTVNPLLTLNRLHPEQPQNFQQEPEPGPGSSLESSHDSAPVSAPEFSSLPALAAPAADVLHSPIPEPDGVIQSQPVESIAAPGTVPSAASENLSSPVDPLASHDALGDAPVGSVLPGVESSPESIDLAPPDSPGSAVVRDVPHTANEYIVTLPMAASTRLHYLEAIRSNGSTLMSFGDHFTANATHFPSRALVAKVDGVFRRLYDLCDLPAFAESLPEMAAEEMRRHATGTNSKFSFVYELLNFIDDPAMKILIVARPGRVLEYLHAVVSTSGFSYGMLGNDDDADEEAHGPSVTLASSDQDLSHVSPYTELIILFDSTARTIDLPPKMRDSTGPVILSLVVTCSIEHIDLRLSETMDPLERRNAMNFALAASQSLIRDPERGSALEPHEIAERFARFLQGRSDDLDWEPQSIPDHLFDVYLSSQAIPTNPAAVVATRQTEEEAARSAARKRLLHEVDEGTPKRARMSEGFEPASTRTPPLMSDLLKKTLGEEALDKPTGPAVEISVERLEHMAAKIARLSDEIRDKEQIERNLAERCRSLEEQVRSHTKFVQEIQPKYMEALHDRGMFEKERDQAREEARKAEKRLETSNNENTRLKQKIADLEKTMEQAAAEASKSREASDAGAPNSWAVVKELEEAKTKIQSLEKKLTSAQRDLDYFRDAYQNASSAGSELGTENRELKERIEQLERKADDNLARVQEINAENMLREYQRLWEEEHAIIADRERDLERVREELRVFKNGRRETRGASVPRSPRMAIMSPRAPRGASVAGSRGNSPASSSVFDGPPLPSTTFFNQQPGSNRWGHLKD